MPPLLPPSACPLIRLFLCSRCGGTARTAPLASSSSSLSSSLLLLFLPLSDADFAGAVTAVGRRLEEGHKRVGHGRPAKPTNHSVPPSLSPPTAAGCAFLFLFLFLLLLFFAAASTTAAAADEEEDEYAGFPRLSEVERKEGQDGLGDGGRGLSSTAKPPATNPATAAPRPPLPPTPFPFRLSCAAPRARTAAAAALLLLGACSYCYIAASPFFVAASCSCSCSCRFLFRRCRRRRPPAGGC